MEDKKRLIKSISITFGILIVLLLVLFFVGKAFGLFSYAKEGQTRSIVTLGGIKVTILNDSEDNLDLINGYPMPDSEGLLRNPIEFNIENAGTQKALDITLKLVNDTEAQDNCVIEGTNTPCTALSANKIRYAYKINNGSYSTPANLGENNNIIFNDLIDPQEVMKVSLVIWIDKEAGNEIQGSYFYGNLVITGEKHVTHIGTSFAFDGTDLETGEQPTQPITNYDFVTPEAGYYRLEVWGASGGDSQTKDGNGYPTSYRGGYGAYSVGEVYLEDNTPLYVVLGGEGQSVITNVSNVGTGGYNGGGSGGPGVNGTFPYGSGGGGATHIATSPGLLRNLSGDRDSVLIVAGGGGGGAWGSHGGNGGGNSSTSYQNCNINISATVATQTTGYSFGLGQNGDGGVWRDAGASGSGGAGGGWYGGYAITGSVAGKSSGGAGGSGYLKSTLSNKGMYCYDCEEKINLETDSAIFTVKTNGASQYINAAGCPNGYSSEPIAKCAKQGTGKARITYLGN